jgi:c-di-AMP phosphodiesterase-like protein
MNKTFKILEIIWLVMAFVGVVMTVYTFIRSDTTGAIYFLVFTFVSTVMYFVRKKQRTRFEANKDQQSSKK